MEIFTLQVISWVKQQECMERYGSIVIGHILRSGTWCGSEYKCDCEVQVQSASVAFFQCAL